MDLQSILLMLVVVLVLAKTTAFVFNRYGIPGLIGEILVGILIANLTIGDWSLKGALDLADGTFNYDLLSTLAELGVIFLLFAVGLETKVKDLTSVGRSAMLVAVLGVIIPFVFGFIFIELYESNVEHALFMGAAMVATSVGITARVIKDMKVLDTKESRIVIGAAVIDDILGMIVLAIVVGMASSGSMEVGSVVTITASAVIFVLAVIAFCAYGVPWITKKVEEYHENKLLANPDYVPYKPNMLSVAIATCFALALAAQYIGLAAIIGAFLAGMIFANGAFAWNLDGRIDAINVLLVSFFFVYVGFMVDLSQVSSNVLMLACVLIVLAIISKYAGAYIGAKIGERGSPEPASAHIIGIGMIPRGEVGILVAAYGLRYGFPLELYVVVVLMSVITTIIAPPLLSRAFRKKYPPEYLITADDRI
ncbi:MAG: cation:proton antiporter [Thermoplasmatales archaeon]|nr:cation:proton antiporter [Thermoplasmatales archaeon]